MAAMKALLLIATLLIAMGQFSGAADLVTPTATFKDVKVVKVEAEAVRIMHSEGAALVDFDDLPPEMQAAYGWTPEKSAARKAKRQAEAKRIEDAEREIEEAPIRKAREEAARKKAEEEKLALEAMAKRKKENAAFDAADAHVQRELNAAAARARAEIDRDRNRGTVIPQAVLFDANVKTPASPVTAANGATAIDLAQAQKEAAPESSIFREHKAWIFIGVGAVVVAALFVLASRFKPQLPSVGRRRIYK